MASLLGDIFTNDSSPQKISHREKVMKEISLYNAEQPIILIHWNGGKPESSPTL